MKPLIGWADPGSVIAEKVIKRVVVVDEGLNPLVEKGFENVNKFVAESLEHVIPESKPLMMIPVHEGLSNDAGTKT
jgi:hypothetical protein